MEYRNYNRLSHGYNDLYVENIRTFQLAMNMMCYDKINYIDFYPSFGVEQTDDVTFLVYGQAVNGWGSSFAGDEPITQEKVYKSMSFSNEMPHGIADCPLEWVNVMWSNESYRKIAGNKVLEELYADNYRANSSFFWNVVYKSINQYFNHPSDSGDWAKKMVWSNLYKISPDKANPSDAQQLAQMPISAMMVKKELEEIQPKFCLVLTGESWWKPFGNYIGSKVTAKFAPNDELISHEKFGTTDIIVTRRPRTGDSGKYAKSINEILSKIS